MAATNPRCTGVEQADVNEGARGRGAAEKTGSQRTAGYKLRQEYVTSQKNNNTNRKIVDLDWLSLVAVLMPEDMAEYILTRRLSKKGEGGETPAQSLAAGTENNADSEPRRDDTFTQGQISAAVAAAVEKIVPIILQEMRVKSEKNRDELEEEKTNERKSGRQKRQPSMQTGILWKSSNISTRDILSLREPIHLPKHTKKCGLDHPIQ